MTALVAVALVSGVALIVVTVRRVAIVLAGARYELPPEGSRDGVVPISVVCSCRNEAANVPRLVEGIRALDYPSLRVIVVDDGSSDGTGDLLADAARGTNWTFIRFDGRGLGKSRVLQRVSSRSASPEGIVVVLDADHVVEPGALHRVLDYFADPSVAAVTFRHRARNRETSAVTRYCALEGAVTEQVTARGQDVLRVVPNLAGVWAARWSSFDLYLPHHADDAVFSLRLVGSGSRVRYAADITTTQHVPERVRTYVGQHARWSSGLLRSIAVRTGDPLGRRPMAFVDSLLARAGYVERPLVACYVLAAAPLVTSYGWTILLPVPMWAGSVALQIAVALRRDRYSFRESMRTLLSLYLVPVDVATVVYGLIQAVRRRPDAWG